MRSSQIKKLSAGRMVSGPCQATHLGEDLIVRSGNGLKPFNNLNTTGLPRRGNACWKARKGLSSRLSHLESRGWHDIVSAPAYRNLILNPLERGDNHGFHHRSGDRASTHNRPGHTPVRGWRNGREVKRTCTLQGNSDVACRGGSPALALRGSGSVPGGVC